MFLFGLLRGLGFAGDLTELQLPRDRLRRRAARRRPGVEAGQLTVIAAAAGAGWLVAAPEHSCARGSSVPASLAIALVGASWTATRLLPRNHGAPPLVPGTVVA